MTEERTPLHFDPAKRAYTLLEEFKNFAFKGNVIDLAVGVIIGQSFGKLVESLVKNVIMPAVSLVTPGNEAYAEWTIGPPGKGIPIGVFLGDTVNFLIVAFVLFLFIRKFLGLILQAKKQEAAAPPPPPKEEVLLTEIRDLLKQQARA